MSEETADRMNVMLTHHEESGAAGLAPSPTGNVATEGFEKEYQRIGWWKGPYATPEARRGCASSGCVREVRACGGSRDGCAIEWHLDALDGVATLLAGAGESAIPPILEELERQPPRDQAEALLQALAWIGEDGVEAQPALTTRLQAVLAGFLQHDDAGPREWAARSARLLPREQAVGLLRTRLEAEPDADVRRAIEEVLDGDAAGRS